MWNIPFYDKRQNPIKLLRLVWDLAFLYKSFFLHLYLCKAKESIIPRLDYKTKGFGSLWLATSIKLEKRHLFGKNTLLMNH